MLNLWDEVLKKVENLVILFFIFLKKYDSILLQRQFYCFCTCHGMKGFRLKKHSIDCFVFDLICFVCSGDGI